MIINNVEYKEIPGYPGYYAGRDGTIYSSKRNRVLKGAVNSQGYLVVNISDKKRHRRKERIHRMIATAWIPNPDGKPEVHHKDENKVNNSVDNLAWVTAKENNIAGTRIARFVASMSKPVVLTSVADGTKLYFKSTRDARRAGYYVDRIFSGYAKTTKGYTVEYDDPDKYL